MPLILASDVGGTKTTVAVYSLDEGKLQQLAKEKYKSKEYKNFDELLQNFLNTQKIIVSTAVFGVPGPVIHGVCRTPNLPWVIDAKKISQKFHIDKVKIVNDFYAFGNGTELLNDAELVQLNTAKPYTKKVKAFIGAGTGLGEAVAVWLDGYVVYPSEGGHADFAPTNETEIELLKYLAKKFGHVSIERLLSGKGLTNIYKFVLGQEIKEKEDLSIQIVQDALQKNEPNAKKAVDIFVSIYGAEAGNLALKTRAVGGIYIGGGIARTILVQKKKLFLQAFQNKGRLSYLMKKIAVYLVMKEEVGLIGAANFAKKYFYNDNLRNAYQSDF